MSAWPLWSCPPMFWGVSLFFILRSSPFFIWALLLQKAHLKRVDSRSFLPLSFLTGSYALCLHRALLTGLTSNPHINDLHLDISGCEVRVPHLHMFKGLVQFKGTVSSSCGLKPPHSVSETKVTHQQIYCKSQVHILALILQLKSEPKEPHSSYNLYNLSSFSFGLQRWLSTGGPQATFWIPIRPADYLWIQKMCASNVTHQWKRPSLRPESDHVLARQPLATGQKKLWFVSSPLYRIRLFLSSILCSPWTHHQNHSARVLEPRGVTWFGFH